MGRALAFGHRRPQSKGMSSGERGCGATCRFSATFGPSGLPFLSNLGESFIETRGASLAAWDALPARTDHRAFGKMRSMLRIFE
jgi:hypothetical protein